MSAGITVFFTGISEPAVFTFAFAAFPLFVIGELMVSLTNTIAVALGARASTAFCGGLFDFVLDAIIPGAPRWILFIICGLAGGVVMYFISVFLIRKFDYKTPGREDDIEELQGESELTAVPANEAEQAASIIDALGGKENMIDVNCCFTRLRLVLEDAFLIDEKKLKALGAKAIIKQENDVQVVYGPHVGQIRDAVQAALNSMK